MALREHPSANYLLDLYGLNGEKLSLVRQFGATRGIDISKIVDDFYFWLSQTQSLQTYFPNREILFRVKSLQRDYWAEFLNAQVDETYIQRRRDVGTAHAHIGLPVQTYFSSLSFFLKAITLPLTRKQDDIANVDIETLEAISSLAQLDASVAIDSIFRYHALTFDRIAGGDYGTNTPPASDEDLFGHALFKMASTFNEIEGAVEKIALGDLGVNIGIKSEHDRLARAINRMIEQLRVAEQVANQVAAGNYVQQFAPRGEHDQLGLALHTMTRNLRTLTTERERELERARALAELSDTLRFAQNRADFAQRVLDRLCRFLNVAVGRIYGRNGQSFLLLAGYADSSEPGRRLEYALGEGLVGQAAKDGNLVVQKNIPDSYMRVFSGLGETAPSNLYLYPIRHHKEVVLVLEFGCLDSFNQDQLDYLAVCEEKIAGAYITIQSNDRVSELFEESVRQSRELSDLNVTLEEQTKTLRQSQQQLVAQQHDLEESNRVLEEQTRFLEQQRQELLDIQAQLEERSVQLTRASQYKSEFLANMSHELRTPLNSLLLLAGMLADSDAANLTSEQRSSAQMIHQSGLDLLELINGILDLSKVEAGKMEVQVESVKLTELCRSLDQRLRPMAREKGLTFSIEVEPGASEYIETDLRKLSQVLTNLLANAIKFTSVGRVELRARLLNRPVDTIYKNTVGDDGVAFDVVDSGIGIPPDKQELIFEAFQQVDGTTSRRFGGTGLGLSICREFSRLLGGAIHLQSEPGVGSTFTFYLPKRFEGNAARSDNVSLPLNLTAISARPTQTHPHEHVYIDDSKERPDLSRTLLVVEDDEKFGRAVCKLARDQGYKCIATGDADRAMKLAQSVYPDAIILDVTLEGKDGWVLFDRLKDTPELRHIPVQFVSAQFDLYGAVQKGAVGFLVKPASKEDLERVFRRFSYVLDRKVLRVLLVGENSTFRLAAKKLLENEFIQIDQCNAQDLYDCIQHQACDCVVLDAEAPMEELMASLDTLSRLTENTPPVVVSGHFPIDENLHRRLQTYSGLVLREAVNPDNLLDTVTLFLHAVTSRLKEPQRRIISKLHSDSDLFSGKKVLLTDDDMRNVFALSKLLQSKQMEVLVAEDGRGAIALLEQHPDVDIILMDIMMPVMDGYEAIRLIRRNRNLRDIPVIALTAKSLPEDRGQILFAGASDYLAKPVDPARLLMTMRMWLQQNEAFASES